MPQARQEMIEAALLDIQMGKYSSIRAAGKAYGVHPTTLSKRMTGKTIPRKEVDVNKRALSPHAEQLVIGWILYCEQCGYPVDHLRLRQYVRLLTDPTGQGLTLGHNWIPRFLARNPVIRSKIGRKIHGSRVDCTSPEQLQAWFERLTAILSTLKFKPDNMYNMDETGIALGVCTNQRVIGTSATKVTHVKTPENREWVSIIETVSASGRVIKPVVIFKGKNLLADWFPQTDIPEFIYTVSPKGWTDNEIGLNWLQQVFEPETARDDSAPRLLLLDNHDSHISVEFMTYCHQRSIWAFYLLPHSSHVLQPLDLTCFSAVKSRYRSQIAALASLDDSAPVKKTRFISIYARARNEGLNESNIRSGWKCAGIHPLYPGRAFRSAFVKRTGRVDNVDACDSQEPIKSKQSKALSLQMKTPQSSKEAYVAWDRVRRSLGRDPVIRTLFTKTNKLIQRLEFKQAIDTVTIQRQTKVILDSVKVRKRKDKIDSNLVFKDLVEKVEAQALAKATQVIDPGPVVAVVVDDDPIRAQINSITTRLAAIVKKSRK